MGLIAWRNRRGRLRVRIPGPDRQRVELLHEVQHHLGRVAHPVGPRAVGLLQRLRQPHLQPQLLDVVFVPLLRQRGDGRSVLADRLQMPCEFLFTLGQENPQSRDFVVVGGVAASVVHDNDRCH